MHVQYIPRNMHTVFALLCFVVVIHWLIFPYPSGLLHWHCGNLTIAPVPAKQPWWIWINTSCEFIMNDCITTTKQSTTKPCAYFLGYTVSQRSISGYALFFFYHFRCNVTLWENGHIISGIYSLQIIGWKRASAEMLVLNFVYFHFSEISYCYHIIDCMHEGRCILGRIFTSPYVVYRC